MHYPNLTPCPQPPMFSGDDFALAECKARMDIKRPEKEGPPRHHLLSTVGDMGSNPDFLPYWYCCAMPIESSDTADVGGRLKPDCGEQCSTCASQGTAKKQCAFATAMDVVSWVTV